MGLGYTHDHVHIDTQELLKIVATPSKKTRSEQRASSGSDSSDSDDEVIYDVIEANTLSNYKSYLHTTLPF